MHLTVHVRFGGGPTETYLQQCRQRAGGLPYSQDPAVFKQALGSIQRVSAQIIDRLDQLPVLDGSAARLDSAPAGLPSAPEVLYAAPEPVATNPPSAPDVLQPRLF